MKQNKIYYSFVGSAFFQALNFILPLIIIPFVLKKIGVEKYGIIVIFQATTNYLGLLIDYSFNIVQVRNIVGVISDIKTTKKQLVDALTFRLYLALLACILVFILALINPFDGFTHKLYLAFFIWIIGQCIIFSWFLQASNSLVIYSILSFVSKLLYAIQIWIFVNNPADYENICLFWATSNFLLGLGIIFYIQKLYKFTFSDFNTINFNLLKFKNSLIEGKDVFVSNSLNGISINTNVFILNLFVGHEIVGQYSIIEKLGLIVKHFITVFHQVTFPNFCKVIDDKQLLKRFIIKNHLPLIILTFTIGVGVFFCQIRL